MAVYGYCRVSTLAQAEDGESLDAQRRQILGPAMQEGWTIEHIFIERGVSAAKPFAEREEGASLLARLQAGDVVLAAKLDRMFRSALDALQTCDRFRREGVSLCCWTWAATRRRQRQRDRGAVHEDRGGLRGVRARPATTRAHP